MAKCAVHIIPVLAIVAVTSLDLYGYFIGSTIQGKAYAVAQKIDLLAISCKIFSESMHFV